MEFNLAFKGLIDYCVIVSDFQNVIDVVVVVVNVVVFFVVVFVISVPLMFCNSNYLRLLSRYVHNQGCTVMLLEVNGSVEGTLVSCHVSYSGFRFCVFVLVL